MKKKVLLPIVIVLLLAAGAFGGWFIFNNKPEKQEEIPAADMHALIKENRNSAFSFLQKNEPDMPENMKGYILDFSTDIDMTDATQEGIRGQISNTFSGVDAINPDTVVIKYQKDLSYSVDGFDALDYLTGYVKDCGMYCILLLGDDSAAYKLSEIEAIAESCLPDAVAVAYNTLTEEFSDIKKGINDKGIAFGIMLDDAPDAASTAFISQHSPDFCFVRINNTLAQGAESTIKQWSELALKSETRFYSILRNELVRNAQGWEDSDEIYNQLRCIYNNVAFSGCVYNSHKGLQSNENEVTSDIYFYNEYFNNKEYTALTITAFNIADNKKIIIEGQSEAEYPLAVYSTAADSWQMIENRNENGDFKADILLSDGENKIIIRHKNAMSTYNIIRAVDVMTSGISSIEDGVLKLTVTAVKNANVYASVANTVLLELQPATEADGIVTYTAEYTIPEEYRNLTSDQISFAAEYCGITDIEMCGEQGSPSYYNNNGFGRSDICVVSSDYTETTSNTSADDSSDVLCTPQLATAFAAITECCVKDGYVVCCTDSGMKIHADKATIILDAYNLPTNKLHLDSVKSDKNYTSLTFETDYIPFIKTEVAPQEYKKGAMDKLHNVDEFTGEYIDITFFKTDEFSYTQEPDFSESDIISKAEWYADTEGTFMTLRLYFREKADFGGYSLSAANGAIKLMLKKKPDTLQGTLIMLDPGHGGYGAPGTYSTSSAYEHAVVYSIATKAADILRDKGATVIITRADDESMSLTERVAMIREYNPDVFASIHCDGSDNEAWFGTHTFYYRNYSMPLASAIHENLLAAYRANVYTSVDSDGYTDVDKSCKFFPYMVTRVEECPSVLIECGYLTNPDDAGFLTSESGQLAAAKAIAQGITDYIEK